MTTQAEERKKELMANAERIATEILSLSRNSLFVTLRFLDVALCQFLFISDPEVKTISTTGKHVIFNTNYVIQEYMNDKQSLARDYLHMVLHCIFRHPFVSDALDREYWDLATDIAVEGIISDLQVKQTKCKNEEDIENALQMVRGRMKTITAEKVYQMLQAREFSTMEIKEMKSIFCRDNHYIWWDLAEQAAEQAKKEKEQREAESADEDYESDYEDDSTEETSEKGSDEEMQEQEQSEESSDDNNGESADEDELSDEENDGEDHGSESDESDQDSDEDSDSDSDQPDEEEDKDDDDTVTWSNVEDPDGTPGDDPDAEPDPEAETHPSDEEGEGKGQGESSGEPGEEQREDNGEGSPQSGEADGQGGEGKEGGEGEEKGGSSNKAPEPKIGDEQQQTLGQKKSSSGKGQRQQRSTSQQAGEASSGMGGGDGSQAAWQHQSEGLSQDGQENEQSQRGGNRKQQSRQMAEAVEGDKGKPGDNGQEGERSPSDQLGMPMDDEREHQYLQNEADLKELEKRWKEISERLLVDLETSSKEWGDQSNALLQEIKHINRDKYDYSVFLQKFATFREDIQINPDEFDYVYYTYGLEKYGNMPLIEPLEYKEVKKVHDFVIAVDTSGSCSGEVVQKFLDKTYSILTQTENFFKKVNIHIIQCDAEIQNDVKITSKEEFDTYVKKMEFYGFGGTDFRPVFEYVNELVEQNEFADLKGLIYFTDGNGTYPTKRPKYETAFVFVDDDTFDYDVPSWAMKLVLETQDILEEVKIN